MFDARGDVVADQAHALDAVDAAQRRFVGVPPFDGAVGGVDGGFVAENDNQVDPPQQVGSIGWGCASRMSTPLPAATRPTARSARVRIGAGGMNLDRATGRFAHQTGSPLRLAAVADTHEQHRRVGPWPSTDEFVEKASTSATNASNVNAG